MCEREQEKGGGEGGFLMTTISISSNESLSRFHYKFPATVEIVAVSRAAFLQQFEQQFFL